MNDGGKVLEKVDSNIERVLEPFEKFLGVVGTVSSSLNTGMIFLNSFVEFVTRTLFCAFQKDSLEYYEKMQAWVNGLVEQVGKAIRFVQQIKGYLEAANPFKKLMSGLFRAFKDFTSIVGDVASFAEVLGFINGLFDFEICYSLPRGCTKKVDFGPFGTAKIPWICWGKKSCTDLEAIGKFMKKIEDIIRSIPLVGELWGAIESFVTGVLNELFKFFGSLLPSFK